MRVTYYGRELYHAEERAGHRYIARIPFGDKFRYFYDQAELAAYKAGKAMGGAAKAAGKAAEEAGRNIQGAANAVGRSARNAYMQTKSKINSAKGQKIYEKQVTSKHDYMKNPNSRDIERARQGKSSNPIGRAGAVASRTMRDVGKSASKFASDVGSNISKTGKNLQKSLKYSPVGNAYMQTKSKVNSAKGQKIYEKQVTSKNDYMKNPNSRDIERARQGKSSNPIGRAGAVASRTMRDVGDNISKAMRGAGRSVDRAVNEAKNFAARNFGTTKGKNSNIHSGNQGYVSKKSAPKYNQGSANITTGRNNAPKSNQGSASITTGRNNAPKSNQGIDSKAGSRFMDNVAATSDRSTTKKIGKSASGLYVNPTGKNNAPKSNQGYNSKDTTGKNNAPKSNQGYNSKAKQYAQNDWDEATSSLKKESKGPNLWAGAETGGKAIASRATKESKDAQHKKEISDSKRLKNLEKQFMRNYMADGHSAADAKRWAKKAAENYMKKHS